MTGVRKLIFLGVFGAGGVALLLWLGFWQLERLAWKQGLIAELERRAAEPAVSVTGGETETEDHYKPVVAEGRFVPEAEGPQLRFLTSEKPFGPGFKIIAAFELDSGARILVDRGFAPERAAPRGAAAPEPPSARQEVRGVLRWPKETSRFTPDPNLEDRLVFAREVSVMAGLLKTAPVMIEAASIATADAGRPVEAGGAWPRAKPAEVRLPNDHLGYAITWFSIAAVWLVMTVAVAMGARRRGVLTT